MNDYRYILDDSSKKFSCSSCGKKRFVRYIDSETGNYLPDQYGRCDRADNCTYHLDPYKDGYAKIIRDQEKGLRAVNWKAPNPKSRKITKSKIAPVFIPSEILKRTLHGYDKNIFVQNLLNQVPFPFEVADVEKVVSFYFLGTVTKGYRSGGITFPFIDSNQNIRAVQIKQFDGDNHTTGTDFLHSIIEKHYTRTEKQLPGWLKAYTEQDKRVSCLFGEHLLSKYPNNPVALVEAPKTAIYGSLCFGFPEKTTDSENITKNHDSLIWLAVYNKSSFTFEKIKALQGRNVIVFPDLSKDGGTFSEWREKAIDFEKRLPDTRFTISNLLEQLAPQSDRNDGKDIADYLIKIDWREFRRLSKARTKQGVEPSKKELFDQSKEFPKVDKNEKLETAKSDKPIDFYVYRENKSENAEKAIIGYPAYIDNIGKLYIPTPLADTYTIYPDIEAYNIRKCLPEFEKRNAVQSDNLTSVTIEPGTLTIQHKFHNYK